MVLFVFDILSNYYDINHDFKILHILQKQSGTWAEVNP